MTVLHIWNTAGVASLMARSLRGIGIKADVLIRSLHDPFQFGLFYGFDPLDLDAKQFTGVCISTAKQYDVIHIHSAHRIIPLLREEYPLKRIIYQAHGSEITNGDPDEYTSNISKADAVISSTKDLNEILLNAGIENALILNAVDTCLFKDTSSERNGDLLMQLPYLNMDETIRISKQYSENFTIFNRSNHIPFWKMPELLNKYNRFIDVKVGTWMNEPTQARSKTAIEALACGCTVINYDGTISKGLPEENTPEYQLNKIKQIYDT